MLRISYCLQNQLIDGHEVVSLTRWPRSAPQKYFLVLTSVLDRAYPMSVVRLEGISKLKKKIAMTSSGLEPVSFRFVV
jgi:hypothetical protein